MLTCPHCNTKADPSEDLIDQLVADPYHTLIYKCLRCDKVSLLNKETRSLDKFSNEIGNELFEMIDEANKKRRGVINRHFNN